ncbi:penicillin acylase family protein, partial [Pseudomonas putida]
DDAEGKRLVEQLAAWKGDYPVDSTAATLFNQLLFQIAEGALHDELGDAFFDSLIATRAIDSALPRLAADADSPWWDDRRTERRETR